MVIEIIPPGSSAVVTERGNYERCSPSEHILQAINTLSNEDATRQLAIMGAVKDAEADVVRTVKDTEADLERSSGMHYADTVKTVKDAEAQLDRASGDRFMQTVQDIKDAESRLHKDAGDKFINLVQDVKDAEFRLDKSAGDRFIWTLQDINKGTLETERAKAKVVETIKDSEYEGEKSEGRTRELMERGFKQVLLESCESFDELGDKVYKSSERVGDKVEAARREMLYEFKAAEKVAFENQMKTLLQFKDQELLSEKLAAKAAAQAAECCCEIKELVRADGDRTRALINVQEVDRLRDKASKAENQLAAYFARGVAPVIP